MKKDKLIQELNSSLKLILNNEYILDSINIPMMALAQIIVTDVTKNNIDLTIYSQRPGLIIGKQGCCIDALKDYLSIIMEKKVNITLVELDKNTFNISVESRFTKIINKIKSWRLIK